MIQNENFLRMLLVANQRKRYSLIVIDSDFDQARSGHVASYYSSPFLLTRNVIIE